MTRRPSALHGRDNYPVGLSADELARLYRMPDRRRRIPFTWYNMHDYDTDDGAQPPSADLCHRMAHDDGLCDCDAFRGGR